MTTKPTITERVLAHFGGSTTELAKQLTETTGQYYSPQQCGHWMKVGRIPPQHMSAVSLLTGIPVEEIAPELFKAFNRSRGA